MSNKRRYSDLENLVETKDINWNLCILCQRKTNEKLECPAELKRKDYDPAKTYENIASNYNRFRQFDSLPNDASFVLPGEACDSNLFMTMKAKFHKICRNKFNNLKVQRLEAKREGILLEDPENNTAEVEPKETTRETFIRTTRSNTRSSNENVDEGESDETLCFFCKKKGETPELREALTKKLNLKVRESARMMQDFNTLARLSIRDMTAQDAMYHPVCLVQYYRKAQNFLRDEASEKEPIVDEEKELHGIVLTELVSFMQQERERLGGKCVFKMADLAALYKKRFEELGGNVTGRVHSTRLKARILAKVPYLVESKNGRDTYLTFDTDVCEVLKDVYERDFDEEAFALSKAAEILRKSLLNRESQEFSGEFNIDSQSSFVPQIVSSFVDRILQGPNIKKSKKYLEQASLTISQLIGQNIVKRTRDNTTGNYFRKSRESPLGVYTGMMIHAKTRKKGIVDKLYDLGLSIPYSRLREISVRLGNKVLLHYQRINLVCPPSLRKGLFTTGAGDNIDYDPSSKTSQDSFHGTGISLFQCPTKANPGTKQVIYSEEIKGDKLLELPDVYTDIKPISSFNKEPEQRKYASISNQPSDLEVMIGDEKRWLEHVDGVMSTGEDVKTSNVSWPAFHAKNQTCEKEVDISVMLPLFRECSKSVAMIRHTMDVVKQAVDYLNPGQTPVVAFDQPLFTIAKQIQWNWPDKYGEENFVIMMGSLHIEMTALKTLGDWLEDSGWSKILTDVVATSGKSESFLEAAHVTRTRYAHQVTAAALHILMVKAYKAQLIEGENNPDFATWRKDQESLSPQFYYWSQTLRLQLLVMSFVRSTRTGDFTLYKTAIAHLLPLFFAFDHIHYARWLSVHLCDMLELEETNPDVFNHFNEGHFVITKSKRAFSSIGIDQAHEQNNKCVKGDGGAIGLTEDSTQLLHWMVCGPEIARCVKDFEAFLPYNLEKTLSEETRHHEQTPSAQKKFAKEVNGLVNSFEEAGSPFLELTKDLIALDSKNIANQTAVDNMRKVADSGNNQFNEFINDRLKEKKSTIYAPIKKNKFLIFAQPKQPKKSSTMEIASLKKSCHLFSRLYIACQVRNGNLDEFFAHENSSYPPSLSKNGDLMSGSKSTLVQCINVDNEVAAEEMTMDCIVMDGAALTNIIKPNGVKTFGEYANERFAPHIVKQLARSRRVDVIWDVYLENSLKLSARLKRGKGIRRRVLPASKIPSNWQSFLRLDENKTELFEFLANHITSIQVSGGKMIVSTIGQSVVANGPLGDSTNLFPSNHEEADTRMLLHALHASRSGMEKVMIRTVDTDVIVIALGMFASLDLSELWISFGTGNNHRLLPIHLIFDVIGFAKCQALPFFHSFTGCDQVSFFSGKGKKSAWKTWKSYGEVTASFVSCSNLPSEQQLQKNFPTIERYVTLLYDRTSMLSSVNECRKSLFATKGRSLDAIPPTQDALLQHTRRASYQASCWGQSLIATQDLPNPIQYGWKREENGQYTVHWVTIPEACAICNELICCGCNPSKGCKGHCKCKKEKLDCTALCKCGGDC